MTPFRTVLYGTCLVDGQHPLGSKLARECPALRRQERCEHGPQGVDSGAPAGASSKPLHSNGLAGGFRNAEDRPESPLAHRRLKPGRPVTQEPSRFARFRRRHPEYQQREAERLKARRATA